MSVSDTWTLDELCEVAGRMLAEDGPEQSSGRVREVPDRRTFRYYTTLGLVDRPSAMRGRTALYGRKHLLQLLAIKRLQARGLTLTDVQQRLLGLTEDELRALAGALPDRQGEEKSSARSRRDDFWRDPPAPVAAAPPTLEKTLHAVRLGDGLTVLLEALRTLRDDDVSALRQAAAPLVDLLKTRGLLDSHTPEHPHP
jgi:DNA-binding transcriptional MerR regulator